VSAPDPPRPDSNRDTHMSPAGGSRQSLECDDASSLSIFPFLSLTIRLTNRSMPGNVIGSAFGTLFLVDPLELDGIKLCAG